MGSETDRARTVRVEGSDGFRAVGYVRMRGDPMTIAQWTHRGGSVVTLEDLGDGGYGIRADGQGGMLYADSRGAAITELQRRIDLGAFSRDAWTTPYVRVTQ